HVQALFPSTPSFTVQALWSSHAAVQTAASLQFPRTSPCARCICTSAGFVSSIVSPTPFETWQSLVLPALATVVSGKQSNRAPQVPYATDRRMVGPPRGPSGHLRASFRNTTPRAVPASGHAGRGRLVDARGWIHAGWGVCPTRRAPGAVFARSPAP